MRRRPPSSVTIALLTAVLSTGSGNAEPVTALLEFRLPIPPVVEGLGDPQLLAAVAVSPDGYWAAGALPSPDHERRSIVRLAEAGGTGPVDLEIPGQIRDLVFDREGRQLLALMNRPGRRGSGESWLLRIEVDTLKARKEMRVPASAAAITLAAWDDLLLVAVEDALRTIRLPDLRSGPLYRVPGRNTAVASLPHGTRVLLGQADRVVLVDLGDPPGEDGTPARERVTAAAPVTGLAVSADGRRGLARTEDGSLLPLWLEPLRLTEAAPPPPPAPPEPQAEPETAPGPGPAPVPPPRPRPEPAARPEPEREPAAEPEPEPEPAAEPEREPPARAEPQPEPEPAPRPAPEPPAAEVTAQLTGLIEGPAAREVREVLVLGPDNVIRVARRVEPGQDGRWSTSGLAPGRYRIQLAAGPGRQLVTDPPFAVVEIGGSAPVTARTIHVLRAL